MPAIFFFYNSTMKHILVISGKQYSGKDTLAEILLSKLVDYRRVGLGDAIKLEYSKRKNIAFDEILKNKHLYRNDLIELGNWGRNIDKNYWINKLLGYDKIIVPDIRLRYEADFFKKAGAFLIRVESDYINRSRRGVIVNNNDITEVDLDNYSKFDITVYNNSDYLTLIKEADKVLNAYKCFIG